MPNKLLLLDFNGNKLTELKDFVKFLMLCENFKLLRVEKNDIEDKSEIEKMKLEFEIAWESFSRDVLMF